MQFHVLSRLMIQDGGWVPDAPHFIISIHAPDQPKATIPENENCKGIKYFSFWDINEPKGRFRRVFNRKDAKKVLDFYLKAKDSGIQHFVVNCDGGVCRSAGVAAALSKIETGDDEFFFSSRGPYKPNRLVHKTILDEYHSRNSA